MSSRSRARPLPNLRSSLKATQTLIFGFMSGPMVRNRKIGLQEILRGDRVPAMATTQADLIFVGGRVHTVNASNDVVPALAIGGGRVLAAGDDAEMRALAGPRARVVELRGRSLLPGFIDG